MKNIILVIGIIISLSAVIFLIINRRKIYSKLIVKISSLELYTENFGNKSKPAVLLVSGAMASARFWTDQFCQDIAHAGYFVVRYDHRDSGLSNAVDFAKSPYTINDLARDAIEVMNAYGIQKAHIIGHSMGGGIAQLLALDYPDRVRTITLISPSILTTEKLNAKEKESLAHTWQEMTSHKPTKNYTESATGFLRVFNELHGTITMDDDIAEQYVQDMYVRTRPEHLAWFEKFSSGKELLHNHVKAEQNPADRTQDLKKLTLPTLVIQGDQDCLIFPRIIQEYCANYLPNANVRIIPDMGHMILSRDLFAHMSDFVLEHIKGSQ